MTTGLAGARFDFAPHSLFSKTIASSEAVA
jgi:hypothetical protein